MKRYFVWFLTAATVVLAAACSKGTDPEDPNIIGGHYEDGNQLGRAYMMDLVDHLFADMLEELEQGLEVDGRQMGQSAHFAINGSLRKPGTVWSIKAKDSALQGMTLRCKDENLWVLEYEGDYVLVSEENVYPTKVSLEAQHFFNLEAEGWSFTVLGERTEREDYRCTFDTQLPSLSAKKGKLDFANTRGSNSKGWDKVYGDLFMYVYKGEQQVDICSLSFEGSPTLATFTRAL